MDEKGLVKINTDSGELTLSPSIVRKYLVNGNGAVSDGEVAMFLALCKFQKLNPFLRDAYLIKYGTQPASIITGKEAFLKRAMRAKDCRGFKAGVIWYSTDNQGSIGYTDGVLPPGTKLAGGWAEIYREGWAFPLRVEVSLQEYVAKKNDGTPNKMWTEKPATMIRKIALVQALREAFPEDLAGMYSPEELDTNGELPHTPVPMADYVDVGKPDASPPDQAANDESQQSGRRRRLTRPSSEAPNYPLVEPLRNNFLLLGTSSEATPRKRPTWLRHSSSPSATRSSPSLGRTRPRICCLPSPLRPYLNPQKTPTELRFSVHTSPSQSMNRFAVLTANAGRRMITGVQLMTAPLLKARN
jgi:phage recombination protein Bet